MDSVMLRGKQGIIEPYRSSVQACYCQPRKPRPEWGREKSKVQSGGIGTEPAIFQLCPEFSHLLNSTARKAEMGGGKDGERGIEQGLPLTIP